MEVTELLEVLNGDWRTQEEEGLCGFKVETCEADGNRRRSCVVGLVDEAGLEAGEQTDHLRVVVHRLHLPVRSEEAQLWTARDEGQWWPRGAFA